MPWKSITPTLKLIILEKIPNGVETVVQLFATLLYREIFKRNTIWPMMEIINASTKDRQIRLLREWAQMKTNESSYIQLAGGLLFTTVSSCLQWPGTQNGHWSAPACFYSSILLSLVTIIVGSQQLLILPRPKRTSLLNGTPNSWNLPQQRIVGAASTDVDDLDPEERQYLEKIVEILSIRLRDDRPNNLQVFALQAPIMLLSLAVVFFLAGLASVVFAPLAMNLAWDATAKTAVVFGVVCLVNIGVFVITSQIMHGIFSRDDHAPRVGARIVRTPA